jgi:hypothetical protein
LAGAFGRETGVKPVTAQQAGLPAADIPRSIPQPAVAEAPRAAAKAEAAPAVEAREAPQAEPEKKRGFWGRLFGRRDNDREDESREDDTQAPKNRKGESSPPKQDP